MKYLVEHLKSKYIVCPRPKHWMKFYLILKECNQYNRDIPPPIIIGNIHQDDTSYSTQEEETALRNKQEERFFLQIKFAFENPMFFKTNKFLRGLNIKEDYKYYHHFIVRTQLYGRSRHWLYNQGRVFYDLVMKMEFKYKNNEKVRTVWGKYPIPEEWNSSEIDEDIVLDKFLKYEETGTIISWDIILPWDNDEGFTRDKILNFQAATLIGIYDVDSEYYSWLHNEELVSDYMGAWRVLLTEDCENSEPIEFKAVSEENKDLNAILSLGVIK
jgi:hypothetical protein